MEKKIVDAIRKKYEHYGDTKKLNKNTAVHDIRILLEQLDKDSEV